MKIKQEKNYALITGASRGLGRAFAFELAKRNINLILISLPDEDLDETARQIIEKYKIDAAIYETDLTSKDNILELTNWVNANFSVNILINNAGFGGARYFREAAIDYLDNMIQLNVKATALMTRQMLPNLLKQEKAHVLNVSSMAAMTPISYKTVYPASKAFIHSFTRGLKQEFSRSKVSFSVVNPGPMRTNGDVTERLKKQGFFVKLMLIKPQRIAEISVDGMFKGTGVITLNWAHRLGWFLLHVLPVPVKMRILNRIAKNEVQKLENHEDFDYRG